MIDLRKIKDHEIERPNEWTCLGSPEEFDALSDEFKDQIKFLDTDASQFLYDYFETSSFHTGPIWDPYQKKNFKFIEKIKVLEDSSIIKKWLFNRKLPLSKWVFVLPNFGNGTLIMTWKMLIKNCDTLFFGDDIVVFDETNQWCLTYWHEDELFFGNISLIDAEIGYGNAEVMNKLEEKYPGYRHPLK